MMNLDAKQLVVFDEITLEDLFKTIYERSTEDRQEAIETFRNFRSMIDDPEDLFMNGAHPASYLKIAAESTDNLIKMISSVQKIAELSNKSQELDDDSVRTDSILDILEKNQIGPKRFLVRKEAGIE